MKKKKDSDKTVDQTMNSIVVRKPAAWLYYPVVILAKFLTRILLRTKYNTRAIKDIEGPCVVVGNHACVVDVVFMASAMLPHRLNILTGRDLFTWKAFKPFTKFLGLIPKNQFSLDLMSLKTMKAAVEQGRKIAIYPEGRVSIDGKPLHYLPQSIGKFLKFLNVPVVICHSNGGFNSWPRWYDGMRRGKVEIEAKIILSKEEIASLSNTEIYNRTVEAMDFNDNIYQQENNIRYRSRRPARNMEYALYKCPKCMSEYNMRTTDHHIICDHCGNTVEYTQYGKFIPEGDSITFDRLDKWYDFERKAVNAEIQDPDFFVSHPVVFEICNDKTNLFEHAGEGELYIDTEKIGYRGTKDGEEYEESMMIRNMHTIIVKNEEAVDLTFNDIIHRFYFKEVKYSAKYGFIVEETFKKINNIK